MPASRVVEALEPHLTDRRRARIERTVANRTCNITPVFDGPYDLGNVAAVMRTAEAMGYQTMHVVHTQPRFKLGKRITQGAEKWLDVFHWQEPAECVRQLKRRGYRICATHLEAAQPIDEVDFTQPTAIVFGNERSGVSPEVLEAADVRCLIPMMGFVQSYNISVAAALSLYHIVGHRTRELGRHGDLTEDEQRILKAVYYLRTLRSAPQIIDAALKR